MFSTIRLKEKPEVRIGPQCNDPYTCPLHETCWNHLSEGNVTELYRGGAKRFQLLVRGTTAIADIPDDFKLTDNQEIQRQAAKTGRPHVNKSAIRAFLETIKYPAAYLDFETWSAAIPLLNGVRPYEQIVFQYSLHVQRSPGAKPEHFSHLAQGTGDPRPEFMRSLRAALPTEGSVITFNSSFEAGRLKECCGLMPEFQPWVTNIQRRMVDLLVPFRKFHFYDPKQSGSCSMKFVLPALTGTSYDHLPIRDGTAASLQYLRATFGNVSDAERNRIRNDLDQYCCLDTFGMFAITEALKALASSM
jgi:hypothetical protein